jgi:hypothetical protein
MRRDPSETASAQRRAAHAATDLLLERLGPAEFQRFAELYEASSFRFGPVLRERASGKSDTMWGSPGSERCA